MGDFAIQHIPHRKHTQVQWHVAVHPVICDDGLVHTISSYQLPYKPIIINANIMDQTIYLISSIQRNAYQCTKGWGIYLSHPATYYKPGCASPKHPPILKF